MDLGLPGKTALVTGASRGIGLAVARALYSEGVSLALVAQSEEHLQQSARTLAGSRSASERPSLHLITANLGQRSEVERAASQAIKRLGHVDILVNNAARARTGTFFDMSETEMQEVWQVKAFGYVRMVRAVGQHMMQRRAGSIINIVGSAARTPSEDFIIGSMVNAALVNFTRGISRELARHNVRINAVSPGWTLTDRQIRQFELQAQAQSIPLEDILIREARAVPLQRFVSPDEIANLVLLLASDLMPGITGEEIIVDGGVTPSV